MAWKDITVGNKTAKAKAIRFIKSPEKGTPGFEVAFDFIEPSTGGVETLLWVGWLSEKAKDFTVETLVNVLGFNGNVSMGADGVLNDPEVLDFKREVSLVVELEEYEKDGGVKGYSPRIKWVNSIGGSQYVGVEPELAKVELAKIGFQDLFVRHAKKPPVTTAIKAQTKTAPASQSQIKDEDIPF